MRKREINNHLICPNWKVICCSVWREWEERCSDWRSPLGGEPGVAQAFCSRGSLFRNQLQHGKQEVCEALRFFAGPLILVDQHLQETPRLQLGDVFQITCRRPQTDHVRLTAKRQQYIINV